MEDLLSYDPDVLTAVFQYDVPSVARIPTHVWTRLRRSLEGLLAEKHHGCLSWNHESLQAIAAHRYAENKVILHQKLGEYFGDRIPDLTKKLKKLNSSPLLVTGKSVWLESAKPNYRRCEEGAANFIYADMLSEAVEEVCSIDYVCASFLCDLGGQLVPLMEDLLHRICQANSETAAMATIVRDFLEWLRRASGAIENNPRLNIPLTVSEEPTNSIARIKFMSAYCGKTNSIMTCSNFSTETCWVRGVRLSLHEHSGPLVGRSCAVWTRSGLGVLAACGDSTIVLWDVSTMAIQKSIRSRGQKAITHMECCPVGENVLARAWDGSITYWNISQGTNLRTISGGGVNVTAMGWKSDGKEFVTGTADSRLIIWNVDDFNQVRESQRFSDYYVSSVQWSPSGTHIAALTLSLHVRVWNLKTNTVNAFSAHTQEVHGFSWSPDGKRIASASDDMKVAIWDATDLSLPHSTFTAHNCPVKTVHWCGKGCKVASGDINGVIFVWSPEDYSVYHRWNASSVAVCSVVWRADSQQLMSLSVDGVVAIFDTWVANNARRKSQNGCRDSSGGREDTRKGSLEVEASSTRKKG
jgi:WD40 repeat protein